MTKSNKTLLCCLLTCVMVLACALTILPIATPTTVNAAETVVTFSLVQTTTSDTALTESFDVEGVDSKGNVYTLTITPGDKVYKYGEDGLKLGSGRGNGTFTISFKENVVKIEVFAKAYKEEKTLQIGSKTFATSADFAAYSIATTEKSVTIGTTTKRGYVNAINLYIDEAAHTHTWGEWKHVDGTETHTRTCTADTPHTETENCTFNESNTCTVCGYTKVACDHTELTFVPEVAATCTTTGVKEHYKCANVACGKLFDKNTADKQEVTLASLTIAALDHQWNDGEITTAATCTTDGVKTFTCTREGCGETKTETIPALGHNYGADGKCTLCGAEKPAEKVYKLVKEVSELSKGDKIIFVAKKVNGETHYYAMGALGTNEYTAQEEVVVANEIVTLNAESKVVEVTLGKDSSGNWTFNTNEGQLYISGTSFSLEKGNNWYITINSKYEATIADNATVETTSPVRIMYNSSATRFKPYSTKVSASMILPSIYKLEEPEAPKQFTVTETVTAVENGSILNNGTMYILPNGQIDVVYNVTANSGINALEGTIAWNAELFDFVSMTAGDIFGENNVTVSGESATTKKIAVTIGASNNATGVLLTVRYQLKAGVTAEQLANAKFGFTADVLFGTDTTTKVANTATENAVPMSVRQDATLTVNGVDYTADDRTITLTYNGQNITAGAEDGSVLKIATNHTGYNADCLTWTVVKNAGNYVLKIAVAADGAYNAISEVSYTIVVKQVEIASTNIAITNNTASKDLLGGNAKWTEADFTITYNGETLPDEFSGLYQIAIVNGEVAEAVAQHTLTVELTLTEQASVNYVLTGTDVAEGKLSKQFVVSVVNAAINIIGMPDNVERAYNAQAIDLSGVRVEEGTTLKIYVALNGGAEVEVTENLDTYVKNVGSYVVRFEAHKNANVYSQTRTYTITKCDLAKVELDYNGDTVTWTDTQTNGETVVVKYTIAATEITNHAYTATQKNTEEVKLVVTTDNANYNGYELTLANVYAVTFSYLATHDAETNTAIVKYVFDGQHAASIELPTETGYTFSGWYLLDNETVAENVFDFATTEIKNDITLTGKWTVNTYTVTFKLGNGQDDVTVSVNYGEKIADKIPADPTKAADDYIYTFKYWTLSTDETKAEVNVAEYVVSGDVTFVAEYDQTKNEFTVTLVIKYNDETITTETRVGKLGQTIELPSGIQSKVLKLGKWLYEDETEFDGKITKTATVTATYEIILEKGDVNGDGKVNLDDVVLFRKYLVGGYAIDEIADENIYTAISAQDAASKTMFFKYSANMDNDANLDIRDVATIRMNVVVTTEGGEEQTQTTQSAARMEVVSEAVQYAVLPTNKFVA